MSGRNNELVARAVGAAPGRRVLDATAGLGGDACILAWLGCQVTLLERSAVLAAVLQDSLRRWADHEVTRDMTARLTLEHRDAFSYLCDNTLEVDVVYLDPMFPEKKTSAAVRGEMQLLQRFLGHGSDPTTLLQAALDSGAGRVVLKRPPDDRWQPPHPPSHVIGNRNARYDVFVR